VALEVPEGAAKLLAGIDAQHRVELAALGDSRPRSTEKEGRAVSFRPSPRPPTVVSDKRSTEPLI
jgi:hypothetical protein